MPRILLVDDDIAEISAVKRVLARGGHQPVLATNASDALAAITQEKPALLIVSAGCESGDALRLARGLNDDLDTAGIPLLVLGDAADLPDGARQLARPVDPEQLTAEVASALQAAPRPPAPRPAPAASIGRVAPPAQVTAAAPLAPLPLPEPPPPVQPAPAAARGAQRTAPDSAAASRRAAADALRARAEELRRKALGVGSPSAAPSPGPASPPASRAARSLARPPAVLELDDGRGAAAPPPAAAPEAAPAPPPAPARPPEAGDEARAARRAAAEEARHQAADEALRVLEEEAGAHVAEVMRARQGSAAGPAALELDPAPALAPALTLAAEQERRGEEERRLLESIEVARREAFEAARSELEERARREAAEVAQRAQAAAELQQEAVAAAQRETGELARREVETARLREEAEARARAEADGRRRAEEELGVLRAQLEEERRRGEERVATVMQRAAAEEEAAEELRRMAEDEAREREEATERLRGEEEQKLRAAVADAQAELEQLRKRSADEAQRRAEAEAALQRAEELALHEELAQPAEPSLFDHPDFFAPFDGAEPLSGAAPEPMADPAEEAARRRVAALRGQAELEPAPPRPAPPPVLRAPPPPPPPEPAPEGEPEEPPRPISPPPLQLRAGDLGELPAPRLFALAARAKLEGRLDFHGEVARSVWFEDGRVVGATSAEPSERVEEVALRLGLITRDQHRRMAQAASTLPSRRAALLLLERGFLKASELTGLVRRRTEEVVFGVFAELDGRFRWSGAAVPPEERTALERGSLALAVEGVRRRWLASRLDALLGGPATLLVPVQGAPGAAELGLSAEERRLAALADGLRTLDELTGASPLDRLSTHQVLAALVLCGALSVRLVQGGRPAAQAAAAIDLGRVKDKLEQVRRADYFSVLGVGRHGTPHEVREAADRLQGEFDLRRFAGVADDGLPARLAEILQVVQDAREVLSDERLREEYLRGLGDAG